MDQFMLFAKRSLSNYLRELGVPYVVCRYGTVPTSVAIASCFACPILSTNADLFLVSRPRITPPGLESIAVHDIELYHLRDVDFPSVSAESSISHLSAKSFRPERSPIKDVSPRSRPLIALLMDSCVVRCLPPAIEINVPPGKTYSQIKLQKVIEYVATVNPVSVLQAVMETVTESHSTPNVAATILDFLAKFAPDFFDASQVLSILKTPEQIPEVAPMSDSDNPDQSGSSPAAFFQSAADILKGVAKMNRLDYMSGWPVALVHLFRLAKVDTEIFTALYTESGALFGAPLAYLTTFSATCGPSRILRYVQYCLMLGVEETMGQVEKLIGLRPYVREICYEGSFRYKSYNLQVSSLVLPQYCSADDFLYTYFGYKPEAEIPDWANALILSCLIWHCQKLGSPGHRNCDITECPTVLAILIIASATHFNSETDCRTLHRHYVSATDVALSQIKETGQASIDTEKLAMHDILEVMSVYAQYISLYSFLTALREPNKMPDFNAAIYNRFPQYYAVFPSFKLSVQVARHLKEQDVPSAVASRFWLTKMFVPTPNPTAVANLRELATLFPKILQFMAGVTLKWRPPDVVITNPPMCFIPKNDRPQARPSSSSKPLINNGGSCSPRRGAPFIRGGNAGGQQIGGFDSDFGRYPLSSNNGFRVPARGGGFNGPRGKQFPNRNRGGKSGKGHGNGGTYATRLENRFGKMSLRS